MADTYIWHDFCGQTSGPDMNNLFLKYYSINSSLSGQEYEIVTYSSGALTIHNQELYNDFLQQVQCTLSFSGNVSFWIYRYNPNGDTYFRIKGSGNITFTFNNGNNKCKVKYYVTTSPHFYSYDQNSNSITCPANEDRFIYEINYQTSIATNMAYRNNGNSYLKYANFMTDTSSHSDWHSGDASSVGSIDKSNEAVGGWTNIKHYSIPNYYIGQWGNIERGMRRINADGMPSISKGTNNKFQYKNIPSGLKSKEETTWQFIDWVPEVWYNAFLYDGGTCTVSNNIISVSGGPSSKQESTSVGDFYKIEWTGSYSIEVISHTASLSRTDINTGWNWSTATYTGVGDLVIGLKENSSNFTIKKLSGSSWVDLTSLEQQIIDSLITSKGTRQLSYDNKDTTSSTRAEEKLDSQTQLTKDNNAWNNYLIMKQTGSMKITNLKEVFINFSDGSSYSNVILNYSRYYTPGSWTHELKSINRTSTSAYCYYNLEWIQFNMTCGAALDFSERDETKISGADDANPPNIDPSYQNVMAITTNGTLPNYYYYWWLWESKKRLYNSTPNRTTQKFIILLLRKKES